MAVTKISRISRWTLYAMSVVTVVLIGLFFLAGNVQPEQQYAELVGKVEPVFTDALLYWVYILLGISQRDIFPYHGLFPTQFFLLPL